MRPLSSWQRFVPVILLIAITLFVLQARGHNEAVPIYKDLSTFPMQIANRQAIDIPINPAALEVLGPGEYLMRDYLSASGDAPVNLYIAFFPSQRTGDTIHSPKNCLPGSGWAPIESGHQYLHRSDGSTITVNRYLVAKGSEQDFVLYWYQAHGRVTPSEYWAKVVLVTDAIRLNRTDGALIRVLVPIGRRGREVSAERDAVDFAEQILPVLPNYLPD
jgi:EpsI family protein